MLECESFKKTYRGGGERALKLRRHLGVANHPGYPRNHRIHPRCQSVSHLFALSRWILQGFNPIYENSFSLFFVCCAVSVCAAVAKQNIWFCFALHFSAGRSGEKKPPAARTWSVKDNVGNLMGSPSASPPPASSLWQVHVGVTLFLSHPRQQQAHSAHPRQPVTLTSLMNNSLIMHISHS